MDKEIDILEEKVRNIHPSWSNAEIRNKAVRMFYLNEKL